jgi:hypothetical protein
MLVKLNLILFLRGFEKSTKKIYLYFAIIIDAMTQLLGQLANNQQAVFGDDVSMPFTANQFDRDVQEKIAEAIRYSFIFPLEANCLTIQNRLCP